MMQIAAHGRLGKAPQERQTKAGKPMATTSIAIDVTPGNAEQQETLWISVLAFGRVAEALLRHQQGDLVSLSGNATMSRWTGQDGTEREQLSIIADSAISARTVRPGGGRKPKQGHVALPRLATAHRACRSLHRSMTR